MRSTTLLACVLAITACAERSGDILRTSADAGPPNDAATVRPTPGPSSSWQIQLTGALDTTLDVQVYTFDLDMPASVVRALHSAGRVVICYFSAGTMEPFRSDAARFPESSLGARLPDYPEERWVDVRDPQVRSIMQDRVTRAAALGCDGLHPSGLAAVLAETELGFVRADQVAYDRWLAALARAAGLSIGLTDGDSSLSQELVADFDWTVVFSCLDSNCPQAAPFVSAGKAAFLIEYGDGGRAQEVCPKAKSLSLSAIIKADADLGAFRVGCP